MNDTVIRVEDLSKQYRLGRLWRSPFERIAALAQRMRSGERDERNASEFWALRDVSFDVRRGEVLGILGRNGAGKSTLLKILSRITPPSAGRVQMRGRVSSLLEVGTGFHPELSGRENIYLNGSILGMTRREIRRRFDEIVEFANVERFLETPVKRYSSGMFVRLAFAVAAHLEPEILLVDEVLAVGDVAFQQKCLGKMQSIAGGGRTVLFVSHNMAAINGFCSRCLCFRDGRLVDNGEPAAVVGRYLSELFVARRVREFDLDLSKHMQVRRMEIQGGSKNPDELLYRSDPFELHLMLDVNTPLVGAEIIVTLDSADGTTVCQTRDVDCPQLRRARREPGRYNAVVRFPGRVLNAGTYFLRFEIERAGEIIDQQEGVRLDLHDPEGEIVARSWGKPRPGVLHLDLDWSLNEAAPREAASHEMALNP